MDVDARWTGKGMSWEYDFLFLVVGRATDLRMSFPWDLYAASMAPSRDRDFTEHGDVF